MSVDHRDALLWPHKDSFKREEYSIGAHDLLDNISADISCKVESRAECWAAESTPIKDSSSPSSTEPASMVSDKSSSRGTVETKTSENTCLSTDTEHPISEGSLSPPASAAQPCIEATNLVSASSRIVTSTYQSDALASQVDLKECTSRDSHLTRPLSNASPSIVNSHPQQQQHYTSPLNYPVSSRMDISSVDSYSYPIHANVEYDRGVNYPSPDARNFPNLPNVYADASGVGRKRSPSPLPYFSKSYCQSNFQRFPLYQQNRPQPLPPPPGANYWNSNGRPNGTTACPPYYGQDARRRFAMQQMYRNEQPNRRYPAFVGRDFYPPIRGDMRQSGYPYPGPYNRFRSPLMGHESVKYVPDYHPGYPSSGVRPPVSGYPPPNAMRPGPGSGRFMSPNPWPPPPEAPYHLAQPRPFHGMMVEGPKKRPASSTRGYKRKRAPSDGDSSRSSGKMLPDASDALALSRLLSVNYSQFVSWPEIETPLDVYPPEPAMKRRRVPCHEVAPDPDSPKAWSCCGRKYTCLPFRLRSCCVSTTQDLLAYLNDTNQGQLDVKNNLLSNALKAAITRLSEPQIPTAPPSPVSPVEIPDPLNLFSKKTSPEVETEDSCSEKLLLPPPKRRRISGKALPDFEGPCKPGPTPVTASQMLRGTRREERFTVEMIKASMVSLKVCQYCKMQVLLPTAVTTDPAESSSSEGVFCSEICLKNHRQMIQRQHPPASSSSCTLASASAECSTTGTTILLQSPSSKLCKSKASSSCKTTLRRSSKRELIAQTPVFRWKGSRWKVFSTSALEALSRTAKVLPVESIPPIFRVLNSGSIPTCALCKCDESAVDGSIVGRLLNYSHDKWVHVNCILWSYKVDETLGGCFVAATKALEQAEKQRCKICGLLGAGVPCFGFDCADNFHIYCAFRHGCVFYQNKSVYCPKHKDQAPTTDALLETFEVNRKVYIERDEDALIENAIASQYTSDSGTNHLVIRVGTLILNFLGQLLPEHLESGRFHNDAWIYPVGYCATRIYWSYRKPSRRCHYLCSITESKADEEEAEGGRDAAVTVLDLPLVHPSPVFTVTVKEEGFPNTSFKGSDCSKVWQHILGLVEESRRRCLPQMRRLFSEKLSGERLFGLNEPCIVRAVESLPGVEHLSGYFFKFGRMQLLSRMPSIINPSGCARCEPMRRNYNTRHRETTDSESHQQHQRSSYSTVAAAQWALLKPLNRIPRYASSTLTSTSSTIGASSSSSVVHCPALISPTARYRAMQTEWRDKVFLARSKIQGLGLFAARDLEKSEFIIEYIGQLIRNEVGNRRERLYESQGRGIYMFRADDDWIVDATMYGGLARYINHSCEPNCTAEVVTHESLKRIVIMAKRLIKKGEELTYDYQLDVEPESANRIPCLCGARLCRQWMN